ncbi:MAG: hypothetical protein C0421_00805 [Hyphomonas sp.]|nr:hypothetical protein [Hyphomonas sp.]
MDVNEVLLSALGTAANGCRNDKNEQAELNCLLGRLDDAALQFKSREIRNGLTAQLINASNVNCRSYLWSLRDTQVGGRLASDIFTGGFSLAATLNQHLPTAQLLSGLGAFSSATGASVDRAVFAQAGVEIISEQIIEMRKASREHIEKKMEREYEDYPLGLALADVSDYHQECSVMRGLSRMQSNLAQREAQIAVSRLTALRIVDAGGDGKAVAAAIGGVADAYSAYMDRTVNPELKDASDGGLSRTPVIDRRSSDIVTRANSVIPATPPATSGEQADTRPALISALREECKKAEASKDFYGRPVCIAADLPENFTASHITDASAKISQWKNRIVVTRASTVRLLRDMQDLGGTPEDVCQIILSHRDISRVAEDEHDPVLVAMGNAVCGEAGRQMSGTLAAGMALAVGSAVIEEELRQFRP